ncbi:hypothetical protein Btru_025272 [Bulinus truncatus]|nr:hypothetical protein Btru_025272 [Bulinus truncatus]
MGVSRVVCCVSLLISVALACKYRVCYYTNWAQYRRSPAKFVPENIDPFLCTHIIFAFAVLENHKLKAYEWNDDDMDWSVGMYTRFNKLKQQNTNLKTLLAVGGWNFGSAPFSRMCATTSTRKIFIDHAITFLRARNFDGLDLDWEYPVLRGGSPADKKTFTYLVQELMAAFTVEAKKSGKPRLLLTAALAAGKSTIDAAYEVDKIAQQLDIVGLMTYDYHGGWDEYAGHNSPLYSFKNYEEDVLYVKYTVLFDYYLSLGVPKSKLVVGIPSYGRSMMLKDKNNNGPDAPVKGGGPQGPYTGGGGFLAYIEYCKTVQTASIGRAGGVPYAIYDNGMFLGYDDLKSITDKATDVRTTHVRTTDVWTIDVWTTDVWTTDDKTTDDRTTDVSTTDVWTTDVWTTDVRTTDVKTTDVWTTDVRTTDVKTTDVWTTDVWTTAL